MPADEAACNHFESECERSELIRAAEHAAGPRHQIRRLPAALAGLLAMGAVAAACRPPWARRSRKDAAALPKARGATNLLEVKYFCGDGPWPQEKADWCCENQQEHCESDAEAQKADATMPLKEIPRDSLIDKAKELDGEQTELDDDMDLGVAKDPCLDRNTSRRLKAARLRRLKKSSVDEILKEVAQVEELLEEEINEIENEEDPCAMSEEAALKVEEVMDEELEAAEVEPELMGEAALEEEEEKLLRLRGAIHKDSKGKSAKSSDGSEGKDAAVDMPRKTILKISDEELHATHRQVEPSATAKCSATHEDCSKTECCLDPGHQCYEKSEWWGMCREECIPRVMNPADVDPETWTCKKLGKRTPGEPVAQILCHDIHSNCMENSKCCKDPGFACFTKNKTFGKCMPECVPGPQYFDLDNNDRWECHQASAAALSTVGKWTQKKCSGDDDDCRKTKCCATSGSQCYEIGKGKAQCRPNCTEGQGLDPATWTCKELGYRTPPPPAALPNQPIGGKVGRWVKDKCSKMGEDCMDTQCCVTAGMQCYQKNSKHATCARDCKKDSHWSCKELGTRSWGLAYVGYPSLFCFTLLRVNSYEVDLVKHQQKNGVGIFGCDNFLVFSDTVTEIAGKETLVLPKVGVGVSKDGTADNAGLFIKVWEMVFHEGTMWDHDWTVKAEPDVVLLPDRLRQRLEPHTNQRHHGGRLFVVNCNAWPGAYDFPMMYGSVEIFSQAAMRQYMDRVDICKKDMPWQEWSEDFFFTHCMDIIDVGRIEDFNLIGDNVCVGPGQTGPHECYDLRRAAFHPFKDIDAWEWCLGNAIQGSSRDHDVLDTLMDVDAFR